MISSSMDVTPKLDNFGADPGTIFVHHADFLASRSISLDLSSIVTIILDTNSRVVLTTICGPRIANRRGRLPPPLRVERRVARVREVGNVLPNDLPNARPLDSAH